MNIKTSNNAMQRLSVPKISTICSKNCLHRLDKGNETNSCTNITNMNKSIMITNISYFNLFDFLAITFIAIYI